MTENIYMYFAAFLRAAEHAQWPQQRIDAVFVDARSSNYLHALEVIWEAMAEIEETSQKQIIS
jgi:predicted O-methyltransferase YrrM